MGITSALCSHHSIPRGGDAHPTLLVCHEGHPVSKLLGDVSPALPEGSEGWAIGTTQGSKAQDAQSRAAVCHGAGQLGRAPYGRLWLNTVGMLPTPQGGGLQRERVLRPSQLSPSSAPRNYKAAEAWLRQGEAYHSHPEASPPVSMRVRGCSPGRWPLTHTQSQRKCPAPKTRGAAQGLSTCAEFCTQPRGRLPAATSGLLERWGTLQTEPVQAECTGGPCKGQTADPSP